MLHGFSSSRLLVFALVFSAISLIGDAPARAQRDQAQEIAEQARSHFVAGEYVEALGLFEQAFELDPHPVILYNQARCLEELGDLPRALNLFRNALALDPSQGIADELRAKIAEIETLLVQQGYELDNLDPETYVAVASLSVSSLPSGAAVLIDNESVGSTPLDNLFLAPGTYELAVEMSGFQTHVRTIDIEAGRNISVHAGLRRLESSTDYVPPEPGFLELTGPRRDMEVYLDEEIIGRTPLSGTAIPPGRYWVRVRHAEFEDWSQQTLIVSGETTRVYADAQRIEGLDSGWTTREWGLASTIAGGAILATGLVFGVLATADANSYNENVNVPNRGDLLDSAETKALVADICFITGGVLATTGIILLIVSSQQRGEETERPDDLVRFELGPTRDGWAVGLSGRF